MRMGVCGRVLVLVVVVIWRWTPSLEAQTIGHRAAVVGGGLYVQGKGTLDSGGGVLGGRVYMGARTPMFAWTDLYKWSRHVRVAAGLGGAVLRSERARWLLRGGFLQGGYPIIGTGMEYGGTWGGFVGLDYQLTRTSWEEGAWFLKTGLYLGG